jgi:hypothetical protein
VRAERIAGPFETGYIHFFLMAPFAKGVVRQAKARRDTGPPSTISGISLLFQPLALKGFKLSPEQKVPEKSFENQQGF